MFINSQHLLIKAFTCVAKNLRSQVIKEVCLSYCFIAVSIGDEYEDFFCSCATHLANMLISYPKIVKSAVEISLSISCRFLRTDQILETIIKISLSKPSKVKKCFLKCICIILANWSIDQLVQYEQQIFECISGGLADHDCEVRNEAKLYLIRLHLLLEF